jgi:hypothetical protein
MKSIIHSALAIILLSSTALGEIFIGVYVVETNPKEGYVRVQNEKLKLDGYIAQKPDSKITAVKYALSLPPREVVTMSKTGEEEGRHMTKGHELTVTLEKCDHPSFAAVTQLANGKKILLRFGKEDLLAMPAHQPITNGMFSLSGVEEKQALRLAELFQSLMNTEKDKMTQ